MHLIIDLDVLCYAAIRARPDPRSSVGVTSLDVLAGDKEVVDKYSNDGYTEEEDSEWLEECWDNLLSKIEFLKEETYATVVHGYLKGETNFRDALYDKYKQKRGTAVSNTRRSPFVQPLRDRLEAEGWGVRAINCEADDMIAIKAHECRRLGLPYIVATIDKDLLMIPGKHYRMHRMVQGKKAKIKEAIITVSLEEANMFYYSQLIIGDSTDKIPGIPGYGKAAAENIVGICDNEEEMQQQVMYAYYEKFGNRWRDELNLNGALIHMLRTPDDHFNVDKWSKPYWEA